MWVLGWLVLLYYASCEVLWVLGVDLDAAWVVPVYVGLV